MEQYYPLGIARFVPAIKFRSPSGFTKVFFFRKVFSLTVERFPVISLGWCLKNKKTESVNKHKNKENKNVDQCQEHILQKKNPVQTQKETSKQHAGVQCYMSNPLLTKLVPSR